MSEEFYNYTNSIWQAMSSTYSTIHQFISCRETINHLSPDIQIKFNWVIHWKGIIVGLLMRYPQCIISELQNTLKLVIAFIWIWLRFPGNSSEKMHCGNVVNMPYCCHTFTALGTPRIHLDMPKHEIIIIMVWVRRYSHEARCTIHHPI